MIFAAILATFMLTYLVTGSEGPYGVLYKLRQSLPLFKCFVCTSVWAGGFIALFMTPVFYEWPLFALAFSGGAVLINMFQERWL